jgi:site-specific DNA-methyltransferase (adenine-specific)
VALDEGAAAMLDAQSGERGGHPVGEPKAAYGGSWSGARMPFDYGDSGGASRFFYCAKASREEREAGVGDEEKPLHWSSGDQNPGSFQSDGTKRSARNNHPTVKPVDLMRWLVRLVTPPGGLILDPFIGSGTTAVAAILEGFRCIGIDNNAEYLATAQARIERAILERDSGGRAQADEVEAGQLTLEGAP